MSRSVGRLMAVALAAVAGSAFGSAVHQRLSVPADETDIARRVFAVPITNSVIGTGIGLLLGRRGWLGAFVFGTISTSITGSAMDDALLPSRQSPSASDTSSSQSSE